MIPHGWIEDLFRRRLALAVPPTLRRRAREGREVAHQMRLIAERLEATENANDVQRLMLEAAARLPRDHHEFAERLRDGSF